MSIQTKPELKRYPLSELPLSARNGFWTSIVVATVAFANALVALVNGLLNEAWQGYVDSGVAMGLCIVALISIIYCRRGRTERGIWILFTAIFFTLIFKTLLNQGLGIIFGLISALIISIVGFITLPPRQFITATSLGFSGGVLVIILDQFGPAFRLPPLPIFTTGIPVVGILIIVVYSIFIVRQFTNFMLSAKLMAVLTLAALVPSVLIGFIGFQTLGSALNVNAEQSLQNAAEDTADSLDNFIISNLDSVRVEAQTPLFSTFLAQARNIQALDPAAAEESISTLRSFGKKDPVFITSYGLLNVFGYNVADSDGSNIGLIEREAYFFRPSTTGVPYVSSVEYREDGIPYIHFSSPIRDQVGRIIGILRVRYRAAVLQQIIVEQGQLAGPGSYAVLLDENHIFLSHGLLPSRLYKILGAIDEISLTSLQEQGRLPPGTLETLFANQLDFEQRLMESPSGSFTISELHGQTRTNPGELRIESVFTSTMTTQPWIVAFIQPEEIFLAPLESATQTTTLLVGGVVLFTIATAWFFSRALTTPLEKLTQTASQIEAGDLNVSSDIKSRDEIGALADTFNNMTARLRDLVASLEDRVADRTRALERRAVQLQAAADVGSAAASLRDLNDLLRQATRLISQRFGYYHAGIFLMDERGENAVLRAASSPGGQRMLAREHKLRVGQEGIVGFVTSQGLPRIALDVGADASFFDNPDLPATRSEMALPLIAGKKILGALDVQSTEESAFSEEDVATLQVVADQLAIAIDNARLLTESQNAIDALRRAYGELGQEGWRQMLSQRAGTGFISVSPEIVAPIAGEWIDDFDIIAKDGQVRLSDDHGILYLPVKVRDYTIGVVRLVKTEKGGTWKDEEIRNAEAITAEMATTLDAARLFEETSRRAARERLIGEVASRLRQTLDIDTMLKTAAEELQRALVLKEAEVRLGVPAEAAEKTIHKPDNPVPADKGKP
ncbi:MAG: GAF domain-containing protein [Chloroflexota bacterium]